MLVLGYRVWPVILLGGTLLYCSVLGVVPAAPILAAANTAEGLFLAYLVNRFAGGRHALQTPKHALRFAGLTALTSVTCGATIATITLVLFDLVVHRPLVDTLWTNWSLGSFAGTVLAAPLVAAVRAGPHRSLEEGAADRSRRRAGLRASASASSCSAACRSSCATIRSRCSASSCCSGRRSGWAAAPRAWA